MPPNLYLYLYSNGTMVVKKKTAIACIDVHAALLLVCNLAVLGFCACSQCRPGHVHDGFWTHPQPGPNSMR